MIFFARLVEMPAGKFSQINAGKLRAVCYIENPEQETAFTLALRPGMVGVVSGHQLWEWNDRYLYVPVSSIIMYPKGGACVDIINPIPILSPDVFYNAFGREPVVHTLVSALTITES